MLLKPNSVYHKLNIVIQARSQVLVSYPGYYGDYEIDDDIVTKELWLSEEQYHSCVYTNHMLRSMREIIVEAHVAAAIRQEIENVVLGKETAKFDETGAVIDGTWQLVPGYIKPSQFKLITVPRYSVSETEYRTDANGEPIEQEERK